MEGILSQNNEIRIKDFQFRSLRKYMLPLYWQLRHAEQLSAEKKLTMISEVIREFFIRIRKYRKIPVEQMAKILNKPIEKIRAFESGLIKSAELEQAYCKACGALHELEYFERRVQEFKTPEIRDQKNQLAKNLIKDHGIILPDLDITRTDGTTAHIIKFPSKTKK